MLTGALCRKGFARVRERRRGSKGQRNGPWGILVSRPAPFTKEAAGIPLATPRSIFGCRTGRGLVASAAPRSAKAETAGEALRAPAETYLASRPWTGGLPAILLRLTPLRSGLRQGDESCAEPCAGTGDSGFCTISCASRERTLLPDRISHYSYFVTFSATRIAALRRAAASSPSLRRSGFSSRRRSRESSSSSALASARAAKASSR